MNPWFIDENGVVRSLLDDEIETRNSGRCDKHKSILLMWGIHDHIMSMTDWYALNECEKMYQ